MIVFIQVSIEHALQVNLRKLRIPYCQRMPEKVQAFSVQLGENK